MWWFVTLWACEMAKSMDELISTVDKLPINKQRAISGLLGAVVADAASKSPWVWFSCINQFQSSRYNKKPMKLFCFALIYL